MRVVLCGSVRYAAQMTALSGELAGLGIDVVSPRPDPSNKESDAALMRALADEHYALIDGADAVFVYNEDGYAGVSVTLEIGYALAAKKRVFALREDADLARQVSYAGIAPTAEALVRLL